MSEEKKIDDFKSVDLEVPHESEKKNEKEGIDLNCVGFYSFFVCAVCIFIIIVIRIITWEPTVQPYVEPNDKHYQ